VAESDGRRHGQQANKCGIWRLERVNSSTAKGARIQMLLRRIAGAGTIYPGQVFHQALRQKTSHPSSLPISVWTEPEGFFDSPAGVLNQSGISLRIL
jgi:hypothetical protein